MDNKPSRYFGMSIVRRLFATVGLAALLGSPSDASASIHQERNLLENRVNTVRDMVLQHNKSKTKTGTPVESPNKKLAQWYPWGNWGNWRNW